ncbi:MAG: UvrD-helicase domain-containing protein [Desulfomonilaceae bacterium]
MTEKSIESVGLLKDQEARNRIINDLAPNLLVEAAAGTGKTSSMVQRMVELLRWGTCKNIRTMAAVTFTRKAAAELKSRFRIKLETCVRSESGTAARNLERALQNMEQCFIGTIHSFCGRLLRERPVEADIDPTFEELDEDRDIALRKEAWAEYCSRVFLGASDSVLTELNELDLRLKDLEETFLRFTTYPDVTVWPVSTEQPDFSLFEPVRKRIEEYVSYMETLVPRLPYEWGNDELIPRYFRLPRVLSHYDSLDRPSDVAELLQEFDKEAKIIQASWTKNGLFTRDQAKDEKARWDEFRSDVVKPALKLWREWRYGPIIRVLAQAQKIYDEMRHSRGQLSYTDLLLKAASLLRDKPHVQSYFQHRFTHLLVDEFQDTDPIQAEVILLLTAASNDETDWRKVVPRPGSLFVVGDPKQSIYRFRRADIITYNDVKDSIQKGGHQKGSVVELSSNFRTVESVISWVNEVFEPKESTLPEVSRVMTRFDKTDSPQSPRYVGLDPARNDDPDVSLQGVYCLTIPKKCDNKEKVLNYEADRIARAIRQALDDPGITIPRTTQEIEQGKTGKPDPSDFLIINRNKGSLSFYARKLEEYGIPTQVSGGSALNEVQELKMLYACLNSLANPDDPVALLAVLRGELFGISDVALYEFKKAGGCFSFHAEVPDSLDTSYSVQFKDVFSRMRSYSLWLSRMPPLAAFERIVADLGLVVLCSIRPGGNLQAGSFCKAIEILRAYQHETWTTAQIVEELGQLAHEAISHDGIPANSDHRSAVRIMNLHKVKGLEAPIVFLACPYGDSDHDVEFHIDRSGDEVTGYLGIYGNRSGRKRPLLAQPLDWDMLSERESRFLEAESLRLRYVAATRAGVALIVTKRESGRGDSPWECFHPYLTEELEIGADAQAVKPTRGKINVDLNQPQQAKQNIEAKIKEMSKRGYETMRAKEFALRQAFPKPDTVVSLREEDEGNADPDEMINGDEHGVEWGTLIHTMLQLAMENPQADLKRAFITAAADSHAASSYGALAETTVRNVMQSDLWFRAQQSEARSLEVPFQILRKNVTETGATLPTILKGTIDLIFREQAGWVLVDYKTDIVRENDLQRFVEKYTPQLQIYSEAWQECTDEPVVEAGLYFVRINKYVSIFR